MSILTMILFGLVVGAIAKLLMPGKDPGGFVVTILLGIAGSLLGGFLFHSMGNGGTQYAGFIGSLIGAIILLVLYRVFVGRRKLT